MSKRANGRGSITERGDGRFMVRVTEADGTRRTLYARSRAEAERKLQEALQRLEDAEQVVESRETFKVVSEACMATARTRYGLAERTVGTYSSALRRNAYPVLGAMKVRDIRPSHVVAVLTAMEAKDLSATYRDITLKAITKVLSEAVDDGLIRANPARKVKGPAVEKAAKVVPTREQVGVMIEAARSGATLAELQARLGHSTPAMAMRYQHAGAGRDRQVAEAMSARLAEALSNVVPMPAPKVDEFATVWVRQPRASWHLAGGTPSSAWCGRRLSIANGAIEVRHGDQPRGRVCARCGRRASA